eukprot:905321_1
MDALSDMTCHELHERIHRLAVDQDDQHDQEATLLNDLKAGELQFHDVSRQIHSLVGWRRLVQSDQGNIRIMHYFPGEPSVATTLTPPGDSFESDPSDMVTEATLAVDSIRRNNWGETSKVDVSFPEKFYGFKPFVAILREVPEILAETAWVLDQLCISGSGAAVVERNTILEFTFFCLFNDVLHDRCEAILFYRLIAEVFRCRRIHERKTIHREQSSSLQSVNLENNEQPNTSNEHVFHPAEKFNFGLDLWMMFCRANRG